MAGPTVNTHTSGGFNASSGAASALNVPSGDAVYVVLFSGHTSARISSITDGPGNSYSGQKTYATANGTVEIWCADNVTGNSSLVVTIHLNGSDNVSYVVLDITGQKKPTSFDKAGTGATGAYTSGTSESDSLSPTAATDLLLYAMGLDFTTTSGGAPAITYGAEAGETLVDSHNQTIGAPTRLATALGVYSEAASGTGSQTLSGKATVTGSGATGTFDGIIFAILPASIALTGTESVTETSKLVVSQKESGAESVTESATVVYSQKEKGSESVTESAAVVYSQKVTGSEHVSETAAVVYSQKVAGTEQVSETSAVVYSQKVTGAESVTESSTVVVSESPTGAEHVSEVGVSVVSESVTGAEHISETGVVVTSVLLAGSESISETSALIVSEAPTGMEFVEETGVVVTSEQTTGAEHISETGAVIVSAVAAAVAHIAEVGVVSTAEQVAGAEAVDEAATLATPTTVSGAEQIAETVGLVISVRPAGRAAIGETATLVVTNPQPKVTGGGGGGGSYCPPRYRPEDDLYFDETIGEMERSFVRRNYPPAYILVLPPDQAVKEGMMVSEQPLSDIGALVFGEPEGPQRVPGWALLLAGVLVGAAIATAVMWVTIRRDLKGKGSTLPSPTREYVEERIHRGPEGEHSEVVRGIESEPRSNPRKLPQVYLRPGALIAMTR
jgi:hypothetical protein